MKFTSIVAISTATVLMAIPALAAPHLVSHRAVYDLKLKTAKERGGVRGIEGRMVIEMDGSSCDGWAVRFRLVNDFQLSKGRSRLVDTRSSSWESADGLQLQYYERETVNSKRKNDVKLKVTRERITDKAVIEQSKPKKVKYKLPAKTYFPIHHQRRLIAAAQAGIMRDKSMVYDGSNGDRIYQAISFIGKKKYLSIKKSTLKGNGVSLVDNVAYWPVSISYFPAGQERQSDVPSHQVSFTMYENGVAGDLVLDYGDFAMQGKLIQLDALKQGTCD